MMYRVVLERALMENSPTYWASCASGLQSCLRTELERIDETQVISDSLSFGGVLFRTNAEPKILAELRAADNIYVFLGHYQDVPLGKDPAVTYFSSLATKIDWNTPMTVYGRWKKLDEARNTNADINTSKESLAGLTFRVTSDRICKNMEKQQYTSVDASAAIGDGIYELLDWKASMRLYDVEVLAWIRDMELLLVLGLLYSEKKASGEWTREKADGATGVLGSPPNVKEPSKEVVKRPSRSEAQLYSRRHYRKALVGTSLKPSTSYALLHLADIRPGHIILDPMCGCGTIPLEAADWLKSKVMSIGGDNNDKAIEAVACNASEMRNGARCDVLQWDAANLPIRNGMIDRVVVDMPFGNRCGNYRVRERLCPNVVKEVVRVLRLGTGVAVLMAQSKTLRQEVEIKQTKYVEMIRHILVEMEGLTVDVYVVRRTMEPPPVKELKLTARNHKRLKVLSAQLLRES